MRKTNLTTIGIALFVIAVLLYLMMPSDYMKQRSAGSEASEVATSMDVGEEETMTEGWEEDSYPEEDEGDEGFEELEETTSVAPVR